MFKHWSVIMPMAAIVHDENVGSSFAKILLSALLIFDRLSNWRDEPHRGGTSGFVDLWPIDK